MDQNRKNSNFFNGPFVAILSSSLVFIAEMLLQNPFDSGSSLSTLEISAFLVGLVCCVFAAHRSFSRVVFLVAGAICSFPIALRIAEQASFFLTSVTFISCICIYVTVGIITHKLAVYGEEVCTSTSSDKNIS